MGENNIFRVLSDPQRREILTMLRDGRMNAGEIAQRLGVSPADCVVFEDSRTGIQSGKSAGAFVVGLTTTLPEETVRSLADITVRDFTDVRLREGLPIIL